MNKAKTICLIIPTLLLFLSSITKGDAALPGTIVADALAKAGFPLRPSIVQTPIEGKIQQIDQPATVLKFDRRTIRLDTPVRSLTINASRSHEGTGGAFDLRFVGNGWNLDQHVAADHPFADEKSDLDAPIGADPSFVARDKAHQNDIYVQVGTWDHYFDKTIREFSMTESNSDHLRYDFNFRTETELYLFSRAKYKAGMLRLRIALHAGMEKILTDSLSASGYSQMEIQGAFLTVKAEFLAMSDRDFMLQSLASSVDDLKKEANLIQAIRYLYLQPLSPEWSILTKINRRDVLVFNQKFDPHDKHYPYRAYASMVDEQGKEIAWIGLLGKKKLSQQEVADRLATLLADD